MSIIGIKEWMILFFIIHIIINHKPFIHKITQCRVFPWIMEKITYRTAKTRVYILGVILMFCKIKTSVSYPTDYHQFPSSLPTWWFCDCYKNKKFFDFDNGLVNLYHGRHMKNNCLISVLLQSLQLQFGYVTFVHKAYIVFEHCLADLGF